MLRNYLIVAWRNLRKHKLFTLINMGGLSLSMSVCLVLISIILDHFQYDKFHPAGENTFRITSSFVGNTGLFGEDYATSPLPFGKKLNEEIPAVLNYTNMAHAGRGGEIRSSQKVLEISSLMADEKFFEVFGFELSEGNPSTALKEPYSIVISEEKAELLFPDEEAIGQLIDYKDHGSYKVTGIVSPPKGKSHIKFDALTSYSTLEILAKKEVMRDVSAWENIYDNYNYVVLQDEESAQEVIAKMNTIATEFIKLEDPDHPGFQFGLQQLTSIVPGKMMANEIGFTIPSFMLLFFGLLGVIVILTASINYANLSIARSLSRAREIGIRKANGARKGQIILQFLIESIFIAGLSLIGAIFLYKLLIKEFNELWIFSFAEITIENSWSAYIYFFVFAVLMGVVTGIAPSLFLSRLDVVRSLKGAVSRPTLKRGFARYFSGKKILTGVQFGFALLLLISVFLIKDQGNYLVNSNYGFDEENIIFFEMQGHDPDILSSEFGSIAGVENISFVSHHPAVGRSHGTSAKTDPDQEEDFTLYHFSVDQNYIDLMQLELVAGGNFPEHTVTENEKYIILNEKAVKTLGMGTPVDAIGKWVILDDDQRLTVVGVIKDYHWEPLMKSINPLGLRIMPDSYKIAYFKVAGKNPIETRQKFEDKWTEFDDSREFQGGFLDSKLDEFYQFFYDLADILSLVGILAIVITSLGFLGMVGFELKTRIKEISIRKVLGASFHELAFTLSRTFIIMLFITGVIAIPLAVIINGLWINEMAYHEPISIYNVGPGILIVICLAFAAIVSQLFSHVRQNPAKTLRND